MDNSGILFKVWECHFQKSVHQRFCWYQSIISCEQYSKMFFLNFTSQSNSNNTFDDLMHHLVGRQQHTIFTMEFLVYNSPISLLCIPAARIIDGVQYIRLISYDYWNIKETQKSYNDLMQVLAEWFFQKLFFTAYY